MFNGIIKNTGAVKEIKKSSNSMEITVDSNLRIKKICLVHQYLVTVYALL